jgi:hypothetical protein
MQSKQTSFAFNFVSDFLTQGETEAVTIARDEFERMEAATLRNRPQTVATLATIATLVVHTSTPPFSHIDPYTTGLLAISVNAARLVMAAGLGELIDLFRNNKRIAQEWVGMDVLRSLSLTRLCSPCRAAAQS